MKNYESRSIKFVWAISYILIFCIPLLFNIFSNLYANFVFKQNLVSTSEMFLDTVIQNTNSILNESELVTYLISEIPETNEALSINHPLTGKDEELLKILNLKINTIISDYKFKLIPCLYLPEIDTVITPQGVISFDDYFNKTKEYLSTTESSVSWRTYLTQSTKAKLRQGEENTLFYSSLINNTENFNSHNSGCVIIQCDSLKNNKLISRGFNYVILNESQIPVVFSTPLYKRKAFKDFDFKNDSSVLIDKTEYFVKYKKDTDYTYISMISSSELTKPLNNLNALNIIIMLIALCVGIDFIRYVLNHNYTPIREIISSLKNNTDADFKNKKNELRIITDSVAHLLEENKNINHKLKLQNETLKMHAIASLLKKSYTKNDKLSFSLDFKHSMFVVSVVYIEDYGEYFIDSDTSIQQVENIKLVNFAIKQILEELLEETGVDVYYTEIDNLLAFILCMDNDVSVQYINAIKQAQMHLRDKLKIQTTISVSSFINNASELSTLYYECLDLLDYRNLSGRYTVITEDYRSKENGTYNFTLEEEVLLKNHILSGDSSSAIAMVSKILKSNSSVINNPDILRYLSFDIVSSLLKTCDVENKGKEYFDKLHEFLKWNDYSVVFEKICDLIKETCMTANNVLSNDIVSNAISYVKKNYRDKTLSVSKIADNLGITAGYLSDTFAKKQNEKLLDYINKYRIERSKELLLNPKYTVLEVAEKVGYTNPKTFRRLFKKYTNILPTEFKSLK